MKYGRKEKILIKINQRRERMGRRTGYKHTEAEKEKIRIACKNCAVIHHINGNHEDNRPENRIILTPKEHTIIHMLQGDIKPYGGGRKLNCRRI
jgi:hypothetical protein